MRNLKFCLITALLTVSLAGCSQTTSAVSSFLEETATPFIEETTAPDKTLVAYFSWSGNTEEIASYIAEKTGGDLYEIKPEVPYSEVYQEVGEVAEEEMNENARPAISNLPESLDEYQTIVIGYPIWWHTAPMIIGTFLERYDLTDKDIYPFSNSRSMDEEQFENSMDFVRNSAGNADVHDGLFVKKDDFETIDRYLIENALTGGSYE